MRAELKGHELNNTLLADVVPKGVNVTTAKWVFPSKTDSGGMITKAVARGFRQRHGVDFFETFAAKPSVSSIKVANATAVKNGLPLFDLDMEQAFVKASLDFDVYMKLQSGCGSITGQAMTVPCIA